MSRRVTPPRVAGGSPRDCGAIAQLTAPVVTTRVLVVAAHPDDETIGAGGLLARSTDAHVAAITDGAPREHSLWAADVSAVDREQYAQIRRDELRLALADAGIGFERVHLLQMSDGEVIDQLPLIVARLLQLLEEIDPNIVLTHAYEGGHVDHDATALAVHAAMALSGRGHPHEMALYHGSGDAISVHEFLPGRPAISTVALTESIREVKKRMLGRYQSQQQYALYFGTEVERFRCAPAYDFRQSPHPARPLLYEQHTGVSGEQWRVRAQLAIEQLKLTNWLQDRSAAVADEPESRDSIFVPAADGRTPLVSVIVRSSGRESLIPALNSIASQTYPNIEIVLVDVSGSGPPASWNGREGIVLRTCSAVGLDRPKAANAGLTAATGEYIAFLDDDDWFHPTHIGSLRAALLGAPDARVAYAGVEVIEWLNDVPPRRRWVFDSPYDPVALLCENYIPLNAVLFERALLDDGGRFDNELLLYQDWDFLIRLSRRTRFEKAPGISAVYRWPPGSGVTDPRQTAAAQERIFTKWRDALSPEEHIAIMRRAIEQSELKDGHQARVSMLQAHLVAQDEELRRLRPNAHALEALRERLQRQDEELSRLRPDAHALEALREHLQRQDEELSRLRPCVSSQDTELQELRARLGRQEQELETFREAAAAAAAAPTTPTRSTSTALLKAFRSWFPASKRGGPE